MKIDSHQHFWQYNESEYGWIPNDVIRKDFLPKDLAPILKENDFDGCIAVQARQSEKETKWLLELAKESNIVKGVVGWIDLQADNLSERLDHFSQEKLIKGYRHVVQAEADDRFIVKPEFTRGIEQLVSRNIPYDILIYAKHLGVTLEFVKEFPVHDFVIDHIAKPDMKNKKFAEWLVGIKPFKKFHHVRCKLSGMITETHFHKWTEKDFHPYLESCLEIFGPKRLMIGSDWPVCLLSGEYKPMMQIVKNYISTLSTDEQDQILGKTAEDFYRL
ncbi:MAG: amidohydrolase family protein [Lentisphaeraceae bacterium]|nr:amidohydrolase family protein [Lentisphaeraceae bacterium]